LCPSFGGYYGNKVSFSNRTAKPMCHHAGNGQTVAMNHLANGKELRPHRACQFSVLLVAEVQKESKRLLPTFPKTKRNNFNYLNFELRTC
jgi:hypothetical protein